MQPKFIFPAHVYGQDYLGLNQDYLNQLTSSIELIRRGNINGQELSNYEFGWLRCGGNHDTWMLT